MDREIDQLIKTIAKFKAGAPLLHYITHATFPRFKALERGTRIDFDFPLTALVGANGIGKSSVLHALWGMPRGYSTAKFWFATDLDPIEGSRKDPPRYFYGHWSEEAEAIVETRKARLGIKRGQDYWEPYRWSARDGMQPMPQGKFADKAKDRWNPVKRIPIYINLKASFGSFDRYFYFDDSLSNKHDVMLREARRLNTIIRDDRTSYTLGGFERLFENRDLTGDEIKNVSAILGREYESARIVRHSLYPGNRGRDLSVVFRRGRRYSEAFAGSGEIAAVSAVVEILAAPEFSLILLDEPETSLHPGAQRALLKFLLEQIKLKKHQVVISTHSGEFLRGLPPTAIKVFEDNENNQTRVLAKSSSAVAFNRLGKPAENKLRILVEDVLAEHLVRRAAKGLDAGERDRLDISAVPGGAESILKYVGPSAMAADANIRVLLDGDKRKVPQFTDPSTLSPAQHETLGTLLRGEIGLDPMLYIPGGDDAAAHHQAKIAAQISYLGWLRNRLTYLPRGAPEEIVLAFHKPELLNSNKLKHAYKQYLTDGADVLLSAADLLSLSKVKIGTMPIDSPDIMSIRTQLEIWLDEPSGH